MWFSDHLTNVWSYNLYANVVCANLDIHTKYSYLLDIDCLDIDYTGLFLSWYVKR